MSQKETELFVQGIPIELDKRGLLNIFAKAGPIENVKIISPKDPSYSTTFGFVLFSNKTSAATAIEMFNEYKIGRNYLKVSYSTKQNNRTSQIEENFTNSRTSSVSSRPQSRLSNGRSDLFATDSSKYQNKKCSIGRGTIIHQNERPRCGNFDLSRPFARKIVSRKNSRSNDSDNCKNNDSFSDVDMSKFDLRMSKKHLTESCVTEIKNVEKLKIGELYPVYLTHVNTPSNFFVHLITSKEKTANLMNNMDNYYKNNLHEDNADLKESNNFDINDLCAGYHESFWYRAKIVNKSTNKRTYHLRIIDFGDEHEIPYENVTILTQEFCETKPASIRCKLANIRPPKGSKEWCIRANQAMDTLFKEVREPLFAKVLGVEEFEPSSGRFENIYAVDLIYGGEESILSYFIQNGLGIQNDGVQSSESVMNLNFRNVDYTNKKAYDNFQLSNLSDNGSYANTMDENIDEMSANLTSVSIMNICEKQKFDSISYPASLTESNNRSKLFNSLFQIFKKKDIQSSVQLYKCGQTLDVRVCYIDNFREFYVQPHSRLNDLKHLESCLENYANALLNDINLKDELKNFQDRTSRFDLVLVRIRNKWKRGVYLDRTSTDTLCSQYSEFKDNYTINKSKIMNFYNFYLIDWGREEIVKNEKINNNNDIFILPFDSKLTQIGAFALKCKISEHQIRCHDTFLDSKSTEINKIRSRLFDDKFKIFFEDRLLRIRISQIVNVKNELIATVDLYFLVHEAHNFLNHEQIQDLKCTNINRTPLNCVQFVLDQIKNIEEEELKKIKLTLDSGDKDENEIIKKDDYLMEKKETKMIISDGGVFKPIKTKEKMDEKIENKQTILMCDHVKLETSKIYEFNLQYFDETRMDSYFYLYLSKNLSKLDKMDVELQKKSYDNSKFKYVQQISELKKSDRLEALYEDDLKWYRVEIKDIINDTVDIYFLDYGNSKKLTTLEPNTLRFRLKYDSDEEFDLFQIDYQAVKCCYQSLDKLNENTNVFIEKLSKMEDVDAGFKLYVKNSIKSSNQNIYIVVFCDEIDSEVDKEVSDILNTDNIHQNTDKNENENEKDEKNLKEKQIKQENISEQNKPNDSKQLEKDSILHGLSVVHIESISEFYVQTSETIKIFIDFQEKIQHLLEITVNKSCENMPLSTKSKQTFKIGDFVFGKFLSDLNWYRAVIINIKEITKNFNLSEIQNLPTDGFLYDLYFVDYGNKQLDLPSSLLYSFQSVKILNQNLKFMSNDELNYIINLPFQAICCQLINKKESTRNNETFKSLISEYFNFDIRIADITKAKVLDNIEINKYQVNLSGDGTALDDKFESAETISQSEHILLRKKHTSTTQCHKLIETQSELEINSVFACKLGVLENEIFVNLIEQSEIFSKLENELTLNQKIESNWKIEFGEPEVGQFLLAKFYTDGSNFSWCRAQVIKKKSILDLSFDVFFFDYGNVSKNVILNDLAPLDSAYYLNVYPPFAYRTVLSNIELDLDKHGHLLSDFLLENFNIKVIQIRNPSNEDDLQVKTYLIEIWDLDMKKCLNKLIDDNYSQQVKYKNDNKKENNVQKLDTKIESSPLPIEKTNISNLILNNSNSNIESKLKVKYIFMDNLVKPFYFCLNSDFDSRKSLDLELNSFYTNNQTKANDFEINSYLAVNSENSWYRAQIKQVYDTNSIFLFYIDYGYEEILELTDINFNRLRKLEKQFYSHPRYAFGGMLLNSSDHKSLIEFQEEDNDLFADTLKEYFENNSSFDESTLIVKFKLNENLNENLINGESYYAIEMYNDKNMSLNDMIEKIRNKKIAKKQARPKRIKISMKDMPIQKPKNDKYCIFARSPDLFFVYNEQLVTKIQLITHQTCQKIVQQQQEYDITSEFEKPEVGDLVYALYDDDVTWYRCLVTNCDDLKSKYELFYIDFGNTEIINSSDILTGWTDEHILPFREYEPQAYKCRLYGLKALDSNSEYSELAKNKFKNFITDKIFNVNFIKKYDNNNNEIFDVEISDENLQNNNYTSSAHMYLLKEKLAQFTSFDQIILSKRTEAENLFYINLLNNF